MAAATVTGKRMSVRLDYQQEQDIAHNRSVIQITGLEFRSAVGLLGGCWLTGNIFVNGSRAVTMSIPGTFVNNAFSWDSLVGSGQNWSSFQSREIEVYHAADGSAEVTLRLDLWLQTTTGGYTDSETITGTASLPRIPRVTELSAGGVTLGEEMTIRLLRAVPGFRDTVRWQCGAESGVIAERTEEDRLVWSPPVELAWQAVETETAPIVLTVETWYGETPVGSRELTVNCPIPEEVVPTMELTVTDRMDCPARHGGYIQGQSQALVVTQAQGAMGSRIVEITVSCGKMKGSGAEVAFALPDSGTVPIRAIATDSRGRKCAMYTRITVLPYERPTASVRDAYRCNAQGESQDDGSYAKILFDARCTALYNGTVTYGLRMQVHRGDAVTEVEIPEYAGYFTVTGGSVIVPMGADSSFDCSVTVQDSFHRAESPAVLLSVAFALLDVCRNTRAVGIGMRAGNPGKLSVALDADWQEHRIGNLSDPEEAQDAATKAYVDARIQELLERLE